MQMIQSIQNRIYDIRGQRVMLDKDLAALYDVETLVLNLAVKRNTQRFPSDFMFQLTKDEWNITNSSITNSGINDSRSQFVTLKKEQEPSLKHLPYAFTVQGLIMVSAVLRSKKAAAMHVSLIRAFVEIQKIDFTQTDPIELIKQTRDRLSELDPQVRPIYEAMENLLDENAAQRRWEERERIGFRKN